LLVTCFVSLTVSAATSVDNPMVMRFREGVNYKKLDYINRSQPPVNQLLEKSAGKIQVVEFFNYGCHWCNMLDPYVLKWLKTKPASVDFVRVPVMFNPAWETYGKAYYTEVLLGVHSPLFDAIHAKGQDLSTADAMRQFFIAQGVAAAKFDGMFDSFSVAHEMKQADALSRAYQITAVPAIIVNGKTQSYMTDTGMAGDGKTVFDIVDFIIQQDKAVPAVAAAEADAAKSMPASTSNAIKKTK